MFESSSYKTALAALIAAVLTLAAPGCGNAAPKASGGLNHSGGSSARSDNHAELDLGQDWERRHPAAGPYRGPRADGRGSDSTPGGSSAAGWAIVLGTFSGENHLQAAHDMLRKVPEITPELAGARVHTTDNGSLVVYGSYPSINDARAATDLNMVKGLTKFGQIVYPRAFLSRLPSPGGRAARPGALPPHDLRSARLLYPNADPLYTLQIAVWSDFDSGQLSAAEVRRRAERYAEEQRALGMEAFFHHDEAQRMSIVTVGLFGRDAIEPETGMFSTAVLALMRRYPAHLVNGEPLEEPINRLYPERGMKVQEPRLVVVPK